MMASRGGGGGFQQPAVAEVAGQLGSGSKTRWDLPLAGGGGQKHRGIVENTKSKEGHSGGRRCVWRL
ncbi:hypothetical protein Tco_1427313 [Tanacetum coccineum]